MQAVTKDLSIIVETATEQITNTGKLGRNLELWLQQIEEIAPVSCELLICTSSAITIGDVPDYVRSVVAEGAGYYGLKSAGAKAALGRILLFTDADCRPHANYLKTLTKLIDSSVDRAWAGVSNYDGLDFFTTLNTVLSFGYLRDPECKSPVTAVAHNMSVQKDLLAAEPFGPYTGRFGGDAYISRWLRETNNPFALCKDLVLYHENLTFSARAMFDRHMMETFSVWLFGGFRDRLPKLAVLKNAQQSVGRRFKLVKSYGKPLGIGPAHYPFVFLVLIVYGLFDTIACTIILSVPEFRRRWVAYQFGMSERELLAFLDSPRHVLIQSSLIGD